jgi:hypothetical protein
VDDTVATVSIVIASDRAISINVKIKKYTLKLDLCTFAFDLWSFTNAKVEDVITERTP